MRSDTCRFAISWSRPAAQPSPSARATACDHEVPGPHTSAEEPPFFWCTFDNRIDTTPVWAPHPVCARPHTVATVLPAHFAPSHTHTHSHTHTLSHLFVAPCRTARRMGALRAACNSNVRLNNHSHQHMLLFREHQLFMPMWFF